MSQDKSTPYTVSLIRGDGIGPEIMDATLHILEKAGANLTFAEIDAGEKVYLSGKTSGISDGAWDTLRKHPVLLKGPITTPRGSGYKSLNVTIRKTLGLYANIRPAQTFDPFIPTKHPGVDMVIVRENEEDTYAGIEHRQTREVTQCLKLITQPGSEKIARYAFEFAKSNGRKKITCMVKDNIMKITDGMFNNAFLEVAKEYPEIEAESMIIDIGSALIANKPNRFDVVLAPNLYGDIISDIAAEVTGSVGMCGSANIGDTIAMFEAVHGSAPDIAGKDIANPTALLQGAIMMLVHIGKPEIANQVRNALLKTIEDGILTGDVFNDQSGKQKVGTKAFANAIVERLGDKPTKLRSTQLSRPQAIHLKKREKLEKKELVGVDIFLDSYEKRDPVVMGERLVSLLKDVIKLKMITNRGVKVYPDGQPETFLTDHYRCRFISKEGNGKVIQHTDITKALEILAKEGIDFIKTENLYTFDGEIGYSLGQGE